MKKFSKKIVSAIAALALSSSAFAGIAAVTGCTDKNAYFGSDSGVTDIVAGRSTYTYSSVFGTKAAVALRTLYVAPNGSSSGEGTAESPLSIKTVLDGNSAMVKPGDLVILKDGTYEFTTLLQITVNGTYDKPITIMAEHTGEAILSFYKNTSGAVGVSMDSDYVNLIGVKQCGAGANGIRVRGNYNLVEDCESYDNRNTGIQITRKGGNYIDNWPSYNLVKNCTSHNNYDYNGRGEDADGFAAKLTLGYGNVFDGCIAYRNSDDGWDLYARHTSGNIGAVYIYNSIAFENGYLEYTDNECRARYSDSYVADPSLNTYTTPDGDGNGFKLGGEAMEGDVFVYNCLSFANRMHGFTDNSNPTYMSLKYCTAFDNNAGIDDDPTSEYFGMVNDSISTVQSNFDLARNPEESYNHLDHCLSIVSNMRYGLDTDYIRGSVEDSIFFTDEGGTNADENKNTKIDGKTELDSRNTGNVGPQINLLDSNAVFEKVCATMTVTGEGNDAVKTYTHNITGKEGRINGMDGEDIHVAMRNADGSINIGDYFKVKDQSLLIGEDNPIGAVLNKTSDEEYVHYEMNVFSTDFDNEVQVRLQAAKDMVYVQTDELGVYQDFEAVGRIFGCIVMWSSDHPEILEVSKEYDVSVSNTEYIPVIVHRPAEDTVVTLTATINYFGQTVEKKFALNVVADSPRIGEISVTGPDGNALALGESIIVDKYTALPDPVITVLNAADFHGKVIDENQAEFTTKYEFGEDIAALNSGKSHVVSGFTTAQDGAFKITMKVTLKVGENKGDSAEFVYYVLVASNTANVDFLDGAHSVVVNSQGYNISGDLTSAIGTIYSYTSATKVDDITAQYVVDNGASKSFRATRVSFDFANANLGEYYIYTVFVNGNGDITSEVYEDKINVIEIKTCDDFYEIAQKPMNTTPEVAASTIYALANDLDFTGYDYAMYNPAGYSVETMGFMAFFNGNGHTLSNITIESTGIQYTGVFRALAGGTVTNVKFENVSVKGEQEKLGGIFGTIYYGNVSYLDLKNIRVEATASLARVGGLTGAITSDNLPVRIDHVSLINDTTAGEDGKFTWQIGGPNVSQRIGALAGYIQTGSADRHMDIIISDCYAKAILQTSGNGGIAGMTDARNEDDDIRFINCYSDCVLTSGAGASSILGATNMQNGKYYVIQCAAVVTNISNGNKVYVTYDNANGDAYNNRASVTNSSLDAFKLAETFTALGFDLDNDWTLDTVNGGIVLSFTLGD